MHHLLCIDEILGEIFNLCLDRRACSNTLAKRNLTALARTCKTFKEPALDVLWSELEDLTPLIRCLGPEASYLNSDNEYALKRPLNGADWDIIVGFTRRVRVRNMSSSPFSLTAECVNELSKPPASILNIFPNLCKLEICGLDQKFVPFFQHLAGPRLTSLKLHFIHDLGDAIEAFGNGCPNMTTFQYHPYSRTEPTPDRVSALICQWSQLRSVQSPNIPMNAAAIIHLSHMHNFHHLSHELDKAEVDRIESTQPGPFVLTFPAIIHYEVYSWSWCTILRFLDHLRLPAIEELHVRARDSPTELELMSFLAALPDTCSRQSLTSILLTLHALFMPGLPYRINFHHLHILTVFANIQTIRLKFPCGVDLSERELLQLASSWPQLQVFVVGEDEGCTPTSAITPGGFVQLLERCRSLTEFSFMFDTRGYTQVPQGHPWHGLEMPEHAAIDVRKSVIEEESVEALAVFFHVAPFPRFHLASWLGEHESIYPETLPEHHKLYYDRWERVFQLARSLWQEKQNNLSF